MIRIPHLETDVTQACQLSCVACNHSVPLWREKGPWSADPAQVREDLTTLAMFLRSDRWGALGGEPLMHAKLLDILYIARDSGVAEKTEVWTNGLLLPRQSPEFWRAFDVLVLSVYPGKHTPESLAFIAERCAQYDVELVVKDEGASPNFRTMLERTPTGPAETQRKFDGCFFKGFSRVANYGHFFTCCCGPHIPMLVQGRTFGDDGIPIKGLTEPMLLAYINRSEPLGACTVCAGRDTATPIAWREEKDPVKWAMASMGVDA